VSAALVQRLGEAARQDQRREEVELEHLAPGIDIAVQAAEPFLERGLRADRGIVHQGVDRLVAEHLQRFLDEMLGVGGLREIGGDVMGPVGIGLALFRNGFARAGHDAPAFGAEALHGRMADAAAGTGQDHGLARRAFLGSIGHNSPAIRNAGRPDPRRPTGLDE
jgi:hypothetical protein